VATGIFLALLGLFVLLRTVVKNDAGQNLVDVILGL
jgi:hypothetical protein